MSSSADSAIDNALLRGSQSMTARPRTEVGFVAAVTLGAIPDIAAAWTPLCTAEGLSLEIHGVFCHASPIVECTNAVGRSLRCELADLLIVVDVNTGGSFARRATLVQAKMARAARRVSLSGPSSVDQLDLYQHWYPFNFVEAAYDIRNADFKAGNGAADSGTFGVIDRHLRDQPVWTQHSASPTPNTIWNQPQLGRFIAEMVNGTQGGFGRLATPALQTDWSKVVERLMAITYGRNFHHGPTLGPASAQRGVSAVACLGFQTAANLVRTVWHTSGGQPPFDVIDIPEGDERPIGISIIHVMLTDSEEAPSASRQ